MPITLHYWMSSSRDLTAQVHTIVRTTIAPYYVNQTVTRGIERQKVQPGSVTFIQRFGSAINVMMSSSYPALLSDWNYWKRDSWRGNATPSRTRTPVVLRCASMERTGSLSRSLLLISSGA